MVAADRDRGGQFAGGDHLVEAHAGAVVESTVTGTDGTYGFSNLAVGDYTVVASGYPETTSTLTLEAGAGGDHVIELSHPRD